MIGELHSQALLAVSDISSMNSRMASLAVGKALLLRVNPPL